MKLRIDSLIDGVQTVRYSVVKEDLEIYNQYFENPFDITLFIDKNPKEISISGYVETNATFVCDRCLSIFEKRIRGDFKIVLADFDFAIADEELIPISSDTSEVDLTAPIRDAILLSIPMKILCSEDCKGLCSGCGANLNIEECRCLPREIDTRWKQLEKLLKEMED